jgi:hypothetical protein
MSISGKIYKNVYLMEKDVVTSSLPFITSCVKIVKHCIKDIAAENLPSGLFALLARLERGLRS